MFGLVDIEYFSTFSLLTMGQIRLTVFLTPSTFLPSVFWGWVKFELPSFWHRVLFYLQSSDDGSNSTYCLFDIEYFSTFSLLTMGQIRLTVFMTSSIFYLQSSGDGSNSTHRLFSTFHNSKFRHSMISHLISLRWVHMCICACVCGWRAVVGSDNGKFVG